MTVVTRCQILRLKCNKSISAGAPPQTPLGELTALPQSPYLDLRGLGLRVGGHPALSLHSSDEPGELSQ